MGSRDAVHNLSTRLCSGRSHHMKAVGRVHQVHRPRITIIIPLSYIYTLACSGFRFVSAAPLIRARLLVWWFAQHADARQSPIRIQATELPNRKVFRAPGSFEPQKIVGAKPCPIAHVTTGFMVLRRNGPDPSWFKAWAYQSFSPSTKLCI